MIFLPIYIFICILIERIFSPFLSNLMIPGFQSLDPDIKKSWYSKSVGITHALIMTFRSSYYWMYMNPSWELRETATFFEIKTVDFMIGYLLYDSHYTIFYGSKSLEVLAHHAFGLLAHVLTRIYEEDGYCIFYT